MTAKENALRNINFNNPKQITTSVPTYTISYCGCNHEGFECDGDNMPLGFSWIDIWGTRWENVQKGMMGMHRSHPLEDLAINLSNYQWPDPDDDRIIGKVYRMAKEFPQDDRFLAGSHRSTIWERSYFLVGMDNLMIYFYTEPEAVKELLHRIMDFQLGIAAHYIKLGIEFAGLGDDLGTQNSLFFSPQILNDFFLPEYRRLFKLYKDNGVIIGFHSCGHITPIAEVFIALGVNVLNPIQASANNLVELRSITQGKMALQGGVSSKTIMEGPIEKIEKEVRDTISLLGTNGGYFCSPDQGMPYPEEHRSAFAKAVEKWGERIQEIV